MSQLLGGSMEHNTENTTRRKTNLSLWKIFFLMVAIVFLTLGCANKEKSATPQPPTTEVTAETATPETTAPTEVPEEQSPWQIAYYVDDFGDPTDNFYLQGTFTGTFSNTATSSSELKVIVFCDYDVTGREYIDGKSYDTTGNYSMAFRLLEYNDHNALYSASDIMTLKVKIADVISEYALVGASPNGDLYISSESANRGMRPIAGLITAMESNVYDASCVIEIGSSRYSFKMNGNGLKALGEQYSDMKYEQSQQAQSK